MVRVEVTLTDPVARRVAERAAAEGFADTGEYLRSLAERAADSDAAPPRASFDSSEQLDALLLEGLASPAAPMTDDDWRFIREEVSRRLAAGGGAGAHEP